MKSNKVLAMLVCCALICVSLLGCNQNVSSNVPNQTTAQGGTAASQTQAPGPEASTAYDGSYPIVPQTATFKVFAAKNPMTKKSFNETKVYSELEARTNIHIEWDTVEGGQLAEKKNLLFASGDLPDAFIGALTVDEEYKYGLQGLLYPLDQLIEENSFYFKDFLAKRPSAVKEITTPDGHIYGLPKVAEWGAPGVGEKLFINKTWLEQLGLSMPTNADEFYEVLKAFKEKDPNGNGQADEIPLSYRMGSDVSDSGDSLYGLFGRLDNPNHIVLESGKVVFTANTEEYKQALKWLNKLYGEGLLDQEIFTQNNQQLLAKGKIEPLVLGAFFGHNGFNVVGTEAENEHYAVLPPMTNSNGEKLWNYGHEAFKKAAVQMSANCKDPDTLMRWFDSFYEPRTSTELYFGPFEINLGELPDGRYTMLPTPDGMAYGEFRHSEAPGAPGPGSILAEEFAKFDDTPIEKEYYVPRVANYMPHTRPESLFPDLYFHPDQMTRLTTLKNDVNTYVKKMEAQFIDKGGIDAEWDAYIQQLDRMGLNDLLAIYQDAYDLYLKTMQG